MPNGGIDNCSTCWFNEANEGKVARHNPDGNQRCLIRDFAIRDPYHTYCVNNPEHNAERVEAPVGPVTHGPTRNVLVESPDTPEIRMALLRVLDEIPETPRSEWLTTSFEDEAISQLGRFGEPRAREGLLRVARFNPFAAPPEDEPNAAGRTRRCRIFTVAVAIKALAHVAGDEALPFIEHYLTQPDAPVANGREHWPPEIRYHALLALEECSREPAARLALLGSNDPDPIIAKEAKALASRLTI